METITKYKAFDGAEFLDADECLKHELLSKRVIDIINQLGELPNLPGCGFQNGGGYLQHDKNTFMKVRNELCEIANEISPHKWFKETIEKGLDAHPSWAGRIIGEISNKALRNAWHRIECTDDQFREYGQPYFVRNPDDVKQVKLN